MAPEQNQFPHIPQQGGGPETPMQGVWISSGHIYSAVLTVSGKVDGLVLQHNGITTQVNDHELRLRALEANRWPVPVLSVLVALCSLGVALYAVFSR
jgi:hypothetical protein